MAAKRRSAEARLLEYTDPLRTDSTDMRTVRRLLRAVKAECAERAEEELLNRGGDAATGEFRGRVVAAILRRP